MIERLRMKFAEKANNWVIKPVQSMMDKEFPSPQTIAALNTFFGVKEPVRVTSHNNNQRRPGF